MFTFKSDKSPAMTESLFVNNLHEINDNSSVVHDNLPSPTQSDGQLNTFGSEDANVPIDKVVKVGHVNEGEIEQLSTADNRPSKSRCFACFNCANCTDPPNFKQIQFGKGNIPPSQAVRIESPRADMFKAKPVMKSVPTGHMSHGKKLLKLQEGRGKRTQAKRKTKNNSVKKVQKKSVQKSKSSKQKKKKVAKKSPKKPKKVNKKKK